MTTPTLRHARWCADPTVRVSDLPFDRGKKRYRCITCQAEAIVIGAPQPTKEN
ncbi:MAG: hypothetical protein J0I11_16995 [Actinobacteria bacterium]|nr:hypothetical protein [Actinomycetota bacterium]